MEKRQLGRSSLHVYPITFGGNVFGWTADEAMSFALLDEMVEAGFNAIDTSDAYTHWVPGNQGGESETIIGRWMAARGNRSDMVVASLSLPRTIARRAPGLTYFVDVPPAVAPARISRAAPTNAPTAVVRVTSGPGLCRALPTSSSNGIWTRSAARAARSGVSRVLTAR